MRNGKRRIRCLWSDSCRGRPVAEVVKLYDTFGATSTYPEPKRRFVCAEHAKYVRAPNLGLEAIPKRRGR